MDATAVQPSPPAGLSTEVLERLGRLTEVLAETSAPEAAATEVLSALGDLLAVRRAAVLLVDADGAERIRASCGLSGEYRSAVVDRPPWRDHTQARRPFVVEDVGTAQLDTADRALLMREGIGSLAAIPLVHRDAVVGRLVVHHDDSHLFSQEERSLCGVLASQLAFATERRRDEQRLELLAEVGRTLGESLDYEETLRRLAELVVPRLGDWCAVYMPEPGEGIRRVAMVPADPADLPIVEQIQRQPLRPDAPTGVPWVLRTGRRLFEPDVPLELLIDDVDDPAELARVVGPIGIRSWICIPLRSRGRTVGAISFLFGKSGRRHSRADLALAQEVCASAALAVDNARLYQMQLQTSRTLQRALLPPHLPEVPGLEIAAAYHPGEEGLEIGGDFYDVFEVGEWNAMVIGDVCGKGSEAAALTALIRHTIRAASMRESRPSEILRMLNEAMLRDPSDDRFATVLFARVEHSRRGVLLTLCRAGHPPALIRRSDGRVKRVLGRGMLLGVESDGLGLDDERVELEPGDLLLLFTDGVTERRGRGGMFGIRRVERILRGSSPNDTAETVVRRLESALEGFAERGRDDVAILAARATP